ncbi:MAG: hypothetical protein ACT4PM_07405 [Gemmatimonadales bacterium]
MRFRYLVTAALVGGLVTFAWGAVSHLTGVIPTVNAMPFPDSAAADSVVNAVRQHLPSNGVYADDRGLFAVVSFERDFRPKFASLAVPMLVQFAIEVATALVLAWVLLRLPVWPVLGTGSIFAAVGLAAGIVIFFSEANWYGFDLRYQIAQLADLVIAWFLLGMVLAALRRRIVLRGETA